MREEAKCSYTLNLRTMRLIESRGGRERQLVDVQSSTFKEMAVKCTDRLDERPFVHMFVDEQAKLCVHVTRLSLNFHVDTRKANAHKRMHIVSSEYGMRVGDEQRLDTLIGLKRCLLLCDTNWLDAQRSSRILLVPNGPLRFERKTIKGTNG